MVNTWNLYMIPWREKNNIFTTASRKNLYRNCSGIKFYSPISSFKDMPTFYGPPFFLSTSFSQCTGVSQFIPPLWRRHGRCDFYSNIWKQNMSNASRSNAKEMRERERGKNWLYGGGGGQLLFCFAQKRSWKITSEKAFFFIFSKYIKKFHCCTFR